MPARTSRAAFGPVQSDIDLRQLVEKTDNFEYAPRIKYDAITQQGQEKFEKLILKHVILGGKPLVIDGFEELLDPWIFNPKWLRDNHGDKGMSSRSSPSLHYVLTRCTVENARNLTSNDNMSLTIGHYLNNMGPLTDQFFENADNYKDKNRQRIYLKDIDSPPVWVDKLKNIIPNGLFYWNDSTGTPNDPGANISANMIFLKRSNRAL